MNIEKTVVFIFRMKGHPKEALLVAAGDFFRDIQERSLFFDLTVTVDKNFSWFTYNKEPIRSIIWGVGQKERRGDVFCHDLELYDLCDRLRDFTNGACARGRGAPDGRKK